MDPYQIETLVKTFLAHAIKVESEENRYNPDFNIARALHHICLELSRLRKEVESLKGEKHGK